MEAKWIEDASGALARGDWADPLIRPVAQFRYLVRKATESTVSTRKRKRGHYLKPIGQLSRTPRPSAGLDPMAGPSARVVRFIKLMAHLDTAPWASGRFAANSAVLRRMAAAHMSLITGERCPPKHVYHLLGGDDLEGTQNIVWITNRQQGKTTSIGKFVAALALTAPPCKTLACLYSTKLERAAELVAAAKEYLDWMMTPAGRHPGWPALQLSKNNHTGFAVRTAPGLPASEILARPKNPDTCRGDAPAAAFFDEIAFTTPAFWYTFALPLLQVRNRRFTCTTTPPPPQSFFDSFCTGIQEAQKEGDSFFTLINHSLACTACIERDEPEKCCHKLHLVPPWKSILSFASKSTGLSALMPKQRAAQFSAEVFGVLRHRFDGFLDHKLLSAAAERPRVSDLQARPRTIWLAIDPPAHSRSAMGLCAFVATPTIVVIGAASVDSTSAEVSALQYVVSTWVKDLRAHPAVTNDAPIVPIIECNNNDPLAKSLLVAIQQHPPVLMPFTRDRFSSHITAFVGVWTTDDTKRASLSVAFQAFLEGRVCISTTIVCASRECVDGKDPPDPAGIISQLFKELGQFQHDERGRVSGKVSEDAQDDLGMAFLLALYWRVSIMAADPAITD